MSIVWQRLGNAKFGLANRLSDELARLEWREPDAYFDVRRSTELLVACDFAGSHGAADYESFAFLLGAISDTGLWIEARDRVREQFLVGRGEMSFKGLNDKRRQRALAPFLIAADLFPGNLIVVMISKAITRLFDNPGDQVLFPELIVPVRNWNAKSFRRLLLIGTLGAVLVSGFAAPSQDLLWISDQDEIAPNPQKHDDAGHVLSHCLETYMPTFRGNFGFATTEANFRNFLTADAVAITDLAAGSLVDAFGACRSSGSLWSRPSGFLSFKTRVILDWFAQAGHDLRRIVVTLDLEASGSIRVSVFRPVRLGLDQVFLLR